MRDHRPTTSAGGVEVLRTPEDRFEDLPGFEYQPNHVEVDGLRMAFIDEGPADGPLVLCLHGEPTWSYLYRRMIPTFVERGCRVIAPDLVGFGRSDKPVERSAFTYDGMVAWLAGFATEVDVRNATLFCQDWGGLLGLRLLAEHPDRFERACAANTALPVVPGAGVLGGFDLDPDADVADAMGSGFVGWLKFSQSVPELPVGGIVQTGTATELPDDVVAAYDAPFPDETYKAGARALPTLVASSPEANARAWEVLEDWSKPFLTLWAPDDPILGPGAAEFIDRIPGTEGQPHDTFTPASHFLQEDVGPELASAVVDWMP
ncbi:MAG: alpha/beta fold hydrolase [Acidimicrobiia bacterium]|nr:alpha/beta fold hydrolase [Acidimicrobiia bacterium]